MGKHKSQKLIPAVWGKFYYMTCFDSQRKDLSNHHQDTIKLVSVIAAYSMRDVCSVLNTSSSKDWNVLYCPT